MEFQDFAAKETTALIARALAESSESSRQRLQAFRSAINAATKALETALSTSPQVDVSDLVSRLTKAAAAESEAAAQRVAAEATAAAHRTAAEARTALDAVQAQLKAETGQKESLAAALDVSRVQADELRLELQTDKERIENARHELATAREALKQTDAARAEAIAEREKEAGVRTAAESELQQVRVGFEKARAESADLRKLLDGAGAERTRLEEAVDAASNQTQAAEAKLNAVTTLFKTTATRVKALEHAEQEREGAVKDLEEKLAAARSVLDEKLAAIADLEDRLTAAGALEATLARHEGATLSLFDDLLGGFRALGSASTIAEVMTTLVKDLSKEFGRVALFRVKGNRLEGQEQVGFDSKTDIAKVAMPLGMDSLLTRSVNSGRIERLRSEELADSSRAPFGGAPSCALALPLVVHGETLGILYADDAGRAERDSGATQELKLRFADALLQHGVALLMRLTTELRTLAELRAYAASLLSEMEQMYLSDVNAGKAGEELRKRLRDNLEYARSIYATRIAIECPDAGSLLDDQLAMLVENQQDSAFGRDLGGIAGRPSASRKAEAS